MPISKYISDLNQQYKTGNATEHTYRGDLQNLIKTILPKITITNEPRRQQFGAPDYILTIGDIPIGFIEAKDIGDGDLDGKKANKEQFNRYKESLENIIFTDYLDFHWYQDKELVDKVSIGAVSGNKIIPLKNNFKAFENMLNDFSKFQGQIIKNPKKLAEIMANKARLLANVIENALVNDIERDEHTSLFGQLNAFKEILIHDITPSQFADVYSQTIAYGMFAARIYDNDPLTFTRFKVSQNIPSTNPFLKRFFGYIADYEPDERIVWMIDSLARFFSVCDLEVILRDFGRATGTEDPIIHFYEDFLAAYDPKLRKSRGVWYTPKPVVSFIVRSVDEILKTEFGLPMGLADNSIIKKEINGAAKEFHKVQILDPATGTATFLVEIIKHIHKKFEGQEGIWSDYVDNHLIPRLNGFELLMASYAMAHLNIDLSLKDTGYKSTRNNRYRVFLTNSLESPDEKATPDAFMAQWLSDEARQAEKVKTETPVMVIIGNPPYSGISSNNGEWISKLIDDYKYIDGVHFNERKHWLNDDYVKFLRYGQYFIEKNGSGILAFINPHGFLDNPTFRGMRWNLLRTFDRIYTIDLHGNSKKKEIAPDGSKDENVFDIMQGVSINIFIKSGGKIEADLGEVYHFDLYGRREIKYHYLLKNSLSSVPYQKVKPESFNYFFVSKSNVGKSIYNQGFGIEILFQKNVTGIVTMGDSFIIDDNENDLKERINDFLNNSISHTELNNKFNLGKNYAEFILSNREVIKYDAKKLVKLSYRPFDTKYTYFDNKLLWRWRVDVMQHFLKGPNVGLVFRRQQPESNDLYVFCSNKIIADGLIRSDNKGGESFAPLYLYPDTEGQQRMEQFGIREPNLNMKIVEQIADKLGLRFTSEKESTAGTFAPIDILDYIYAVLHSPAYREKYKEFLKIDFPRVPYPTDKEKFWELVKLGGEIRELHLLESKVFDNLSARFPVAGSNEVTRKMTTMSIGFELTNKEKATGKVWINNEQYFDDVPLIAWEFYIGGYQPAQKWLKDRHGRTLGYEDVIHYQKIIVALTETARLMQKIDEVGVE